MAFQFNPFTGTLDLVGSGGAGTSVGYFDNFVVGDWILDGSIYYILVSHNLNTSNPVVFAYEGANHVFLDDIIITSNNQLRINSSSAFAGAIVVIKP